MNPNASTARSLSYTVLVFALAVPFWSLGGRALPPPLSLPASALVVFVPATAAAVLRRREVGWRGVSDLVRRAWDYKRIRNRVWYVPAVLLAPAIYVLSYAVMRALRLPLPDRIEIPLRSAPALFLLFVIGAVGEELGWTGYATDPLQQRSGAAKGSLMLGAIWAIWHAIPFVQTGEPAGWVAAQSLKTIAMRVIMVWLYNGSGKSVFATILYHITDNLSWAMFPNSRSHYDPLVTGALTALAAAAITLSSHSKPWGRGGRTGMQPAGNSVQTEVAPCDHS
jgi:uncharacterized protein